MVKPSTIETKKAEFLMGTRLQCCLWLSPAAVSSLGQKNKFFKTAFVSPRFSKSQERSGESKTNVLFDVN